MSSNQEKEFDTVARVSFIAFSKPHIEFFVNKTDQDIHRYLKAIYPDYSAVSKEEGLVSFENVSIEGLLALQKIKGAK